jgi:hypothetical protein
LARPRKDAITLRLNDKEKEIVKYAMWKFGESEMAPAIRAALFEWRAWDELITKMGPVLRAGVDRYGKKTA